MRMLQGILSLQNMLMLQHILMQQGIPAYSQKDQLYYPLLHVFVQPGCTRKNLKTILGKLYLVHKCQYMPTIPSMDATQMRIRAVLAISVCLACVFTTDNLWLLTVSTGGAEESKTVQFARNDYQQAPKDQLCNASMITHMLGAHKRENSSS